MSGRGARPPWLLRSAHVQTLLAGLPPIARPRPHARDVLRVPLSTGESLHAEALWASPTRRPTALIVHGLGGSTRSAYARRMARAVVEAGFHAVSVDLRGSGESRASSRSLYHAGLTEDPAAALADIARDDRVASVLLVGFSLGGHVALRLAAEWGERVPERVAGVVAVCPPLDLAETSRRIERPAMTPYRAYLLRGLVANAIALAERDPAAVPISIRELRALPTIAAFDERVIAPMHGFRGAEHYYATQSVGPRLGDVVVPTTVIATEDDPMVPADTLRPFLARSGGAVRVLWSRLGGHVALTESVIPWRGWADARVLELLRALPAS